MLDTWQSISSFLTPATLFLLLNLVIATIVLSSRLHHRRHADPSAAPFAGAYHFPLLRTTSPVLDRLRSFTLHRFRSGEFPPDPLSSYPTPISNSTATPTESGPDPIVESSAALGEVTTTSSPPLARTSSILEHLKSISLYRFRSGEIQTEENKTETTTTTTTSTTTTTEHQFGRSKSESSQPAEKKKKMKKIASVGGGGGGGEEVELRQRRSFRGGREVVVEEEVNARADDFINRFKEQLKIQRLNSLLNYSDMLDRGR